MQGGIITIKISLDGAKEVAGELDQIANRVKKGLDLGKLAIGFAAVNQALSVFGSALNVFRGTIGAAVSSYAEFSKGLTDVSTLLGEQAGRLLPEYERRLLAISSRYGESAESLTKPLYDLISAGVDASKATELLDVAVKAAKVGIADTTTAVDAMTTAINAWHLSTDQATEVMDIFQMAINRGKTTLGEIGATISQVAPVAASLGIPLEQVVAAMTTLTKQGVGTGEAFTQIAYAMRAVLQNQDRAKEMGPKVAAVFNKQALQAMGLQKWMQALRDAVGGSEEALVKLLGSSEAVNAVLGLTGENAKMAADDLSAMQSASGAVSKGFENVKKSFAFQWERLQTTFHNLSIAIGGMLAPAFGVLSAVVQPLTRVFVVLAGYYSALPGIIQAMIPAIIAVTAAFVAFKLGVFASVIPSITAIWAALSPILPLLGAVAAVVALFAVAWKHNFLGLRDIAAKVWSVIKVVFVVWWNNVKEFWKVVWTVFKPAVDAVWQMVKQVYEFVKPYLKYLAVLLVLPFMPVATAVAGAIVAFTVFKNAFVALADGIKPIASALLDLLVAVFNPQNWLHPKKAIADIKDAMGSLAKAVQDTVQKAFEGMVEDAKRAYEQVKKTVEKTKEEITKSPTTTSKTSESPEEPTSGGGTTAHLRLMGKGERAPVTAQFADEEMEETQTKVKMTMDAVTEVYLEAISAIQTAWDNAMGAIQNNLESFFESVLSGTESVKDAFAKLGKSILGTFTKLAAQNLAILVSAPIKALLEQAGAYIVGAVAAIIKWFAQLGPLGIPAGIAAAAGLVAAFMGFKHALGFAEGGLITEPMIALSLSGTIPAIIGERGPEVIAPKKKFDDLYEAAITPKIEINAMIIDKDGIDTLKDRVDVESAKRLTH